MRYERDYSDRDRDYNNDYRNDNNRNRDNDRGFFDKSGDEVRSWFGDDDAERRRRMDERYDRSDSRTWGNSSGFNNSDRNSGRYGNSYSSYGTGSSNRNSSYDRDYNSGSGIGYGHNDYRTYGSEYGRSRDNDTNYSGGGSSYGRSNDRDRNNNSHFGSYGYDRNRDNDRGFMDKAGDEVRSWFGDDRADRRREQDERSDRDSNRGWGSDSYNQYRSYDGLNDERDYGRSNYRMDEYDKDRNRTYGSRNYNSDRDRY